MILRIIWAIAIVLVAAVTFGLQFDRQTRETPELAMAVPEPFRAFAQARIASFAMQAGDPEVALAEARRLVERRPMPAEHLSLLAQAQLSAGRAEEGTYTVQIAAQRGWRDPFAQEALMRFALAAGDEPEAARRFIALFLKNGTSDATLSEVAATLFETSDGPGAQTLITIVADSERWHDTFLRRGSRLLPAKSFVEIISAAEAQGANFGCRGLEVILRQVTRRDESAGAQLTALFESKC